MEIGSQGIIIVGLSVLFIYFGYLYNHYSKIENVKSTIDNRTYEVQAKDDALDAANLIATIRKKIMMLVEHLRKSYPQDPRVIKIKENFNPNNFKEGIDNPDYTSYSINKGEQIVLCLRNKNNLVDINTMMFVVLHELSHIATESIGHTPEFWENFKWILEESINTGIYTKQDFKKNNVEYCGMTITDSPLD